MKRNRYLLLCGIIVLAIAGYLYYAKSDNKPITQEPTASVNPTLSPEDMEVLRNDPDAPAWAKDAVSCTRVGGRLFCRLKGE